MSDDLFDFTPGMTAWEIDHLADPEDDAEKLVILLEERVAEATAERCDLHPENTRPCPCEVPLTMAEVRAMRARWEHAPERQR